MNKLISKCPSCGIDKDSDDDEICLNCLKISNSNDRITDHLLDLNIDSKVDSENILPNNENNSTEFTLEKNNSADVKNNTNGILRRIPGFRTNKTWKKVISLVVYAFTSIIILVYSLSSSIETTTTQDFLGNVFYKTSIISLFIIVPYVMVFNLFSIRSKFPFFRNRKILRTIVGSIIFVLLWLISFLMINSIVEKIYTPEYFQKEKAANNIYREKREKEEAEKAALKKSEEESKAKEIAIAQAKEKEEAQEKANQKAIAKAKEKEETERIAIAKANSDAKAKEEAIAKAREEAEIKARAIAKEKEEAEAKAKAIAKEKEEAIAKAKAEAEVKAKQKALDDARLKKEQEERVHSEREAFIKTCESISYENLVRNPANFKGKNIKINGEVEDISFLNENDVIIYVNTSKKMANEYGSLWTDRVRVFCTYSNNDTRIMKGDIIDIYGTFEGTYQNYPQIRMKLGYF